MGQKSKMNHAVRLVQLVPPEESGITAEEAIKMAMTKPLNVLRSIRDRMEHHFGSDTPQLN